MRDSLSCLDNLTVFFIIYNTYACLFPAPNITPVLALILIEIHRPKLLLFFFYFSLLVITNTRAIYNKLSIGRYIFPMFFLFYFSPALPLQQQ